MKKQLLPIILGTFTSFFSNDAQAQISDSIKTYLDSALYIMQTKSLFGKNLDWAKIRATAYLKAGKAQKQKKLFPLWFMLFNN